MDVFDKQYRTYRLILSAVGLWPYDKSMYQTVRRIIVFTILFSFPTFQILSIIKSKVTLERYIVLLASISPWLLFCVRYVGFIDCISLEKRLKDSTEVQILMKYIDDSTRIIFIFLGICCTMVILVSAFCFIPMMLDVIRPSNESRVSALSYVTEISSEQPGYIVMLNMEWIGILIIGSLSIISTESALIIIIYYICALLRITRYRIRNAIINASKDRSNFNYRDFHSAVNLHVRAMKYIDFATNGMTVWYFIAVAFVILSFALSLQRLFQSIMILGSPIDTLISVIYFIVHLTFMFANNYCGEMLLNHSLDIFIESYNSTWYLIPLKAKKLLLFIMTRSSVESVANLFGLFEPCNRGFATMMNSSFSYFTLMCAFQ
ncbi:uncharacterized protein LOC113464246 isoform X2 [Ceratina calcarata]|uniref:Odorant receptor n=1 Tax=Ceratina calcarata TaxID=156304 RepID=A0AAJ7WAC1_9HYME|nr:uncharacterized protein LOC113464246 isoform X2 [Ceratina calcarata]